MTAARILALVLRTLAFEASENGAGDVVAAIPTGAFAAGDQEESGSVLHDDPTNVRRFGDADIAAALADFESQRFEIGDGGMKARRLVLAAPTFVGPLGGGTTASEVQDSPPAA